MNSNRICLFVLLIAIILFVGSSSSYYYYYYVYNIIKFNKSITIYNNNSTNECRNSLLCSYVIDKQYNVGHHSDVYLARNVNNSNKYYIIKRLLIEKSPEIRLI